MGQGLCARPRPREARGRRRAPRALDLGRTGARRSGPAPSRSPTRGDRDRIAARFRSSSRRLGLDLGQLASAAAVAGGHIGHLLDPRSGRPAPDFGSATGRRRVGPRCRCPLHRVLRSGTGSGTRALRRARRRGFANEALFLVATSEGVKPLATRGLRFQRHTPLSDGRGTMNRLLRAASALLALLLFVSAPAVFAQENPPPPAPAGRSNSGSSASRSSSRRRAGSSPPRRRLRATRPGSRRSSGRSGFSRRRSSS